MCRSETIATVKPAEEDMYRLDRKKKNMHKKLK